MPRAHAGDVAVQRAMQGTQIGGLEACLGWVAAARRAGAPEAAQCKSSLTTRPSTPDGGGGAAAAHLGDDGVQPERASAMTMMRGGILSAYPERILSVFLSVSVRIAYPVSRTAYPVPVSRVSLLVSMCVSVSRVSRTSIARMIPRILCRIRISV